MTAAGILERAAAQYGARGQLSDPSAWVAGQGGFLWSAQKAIGLDLAAQKRVACASAAGIGKSALAAWLAGWWIGTHPVSDSFVMTTSASADQVHGILWEEIRGLHARYRWAGEVQQTNRWLVGGRLVGQGRRPPDYGSGSGDKDAPPSSGQGFHREYVLVILDEAGGLPDWLWDMAENITTGDNCRILAIGNPDDASSKFARVMAGEGNWARHQLSVFDSPNFTGERVPDEVARKLTSVQWAADRLADWTADDPRYLSKVLGQFPPSHPRQVILTSDLVACRVRQELSPRELEPVVLGVDVGDGGDKTVVRERRGPRFGREWTYEGTAPELRERLVVRAILESGADEVNIDHTGVGSGLVGALRNRKLSGEFAARIYSVKVAEKAKKEKDFHDTRAELWWEVGRTRMHDVEFDLSGMANADVTIGQLQSARWLLDNKNRVLIEPKKDIRARIGVSPDHAEAFLLAAYRGRSATQDYMDALVAGRL